MDLAQFLSNNTYLRLFDSSQDEMLVQNFMSASPMRVGGLELVYDRSPKFQDLLRAQSEKYETLLARHDNGELLGMFSFSFANKYINGQSVPCAYIGDFRTDNSRASTKLWRQDYAKIINAVKQDIGYGQPRYILTAILDKNKEAIRSLAKSKKDLGFQYDYLCTAHMVNVFGIIPKLLGSEKLNVEQASTNDEYAILEFMRMSESKKQFGAIISQEQSSWGTRKNSWPGFSIENFLVLKNNNGEIVACTLPWNPGQLKRMRVLAAPHWMNACFKFFKNFGFNLPTVGESLETVYLTNLCISPQVDAQQVLYAFLKQIRIRYPKAHMISFADFTSVSTGMSRLIAQRVGVQLFNVRLSSESPFVSTSNLGFEMALV